MGGGRCGAKDENEFQEVDEQVQGLVLNILLVGVGNYPPVYVRILP